MELIVRAERFAYKDGRYPYESECGLDVYGDKDRKNFVVIATELDDNPGPSITNSYESLAGVVYRQFIMPNNAISYKANVTWVEHYPNIRRRGQEEFDIVQMDMIYQPLIASYLFRLPNWHSSTRKEIENMVEHSALE